MKGANIPPMINISGGFVNGGQKTFPKGKGF